MATYGLHGFTNQIGKISPINGKITEYPVPTKSAGPDSITVGLDGNLWFTEEEGDPIRKISPITDIITEYAAPSAYSDPCGITAGPDGNIWFTEHEGNKIGKIDPATGVITEYIIPPSQNDTYVVDSITAGPMATCGSLYAKGT